MSEELRTEELLTNEGHTETMADYEDHFDDANPWNRVLEYMEKKTILPVKIEGIVNGGAIAMVEGLRGFIPVSKLSLSYIEDSGDLPAQRCGSSSDRCRSGRQPACTVRP